MNRESNGAGRTLVFEGPGAGIGTYTPVNAVMGTEALRRFCDLDPPGRHLLDTAFEKLGLSACALDRILKVARTIADLAGNDAIRAAHLAEA